MVDRQRVLICGAAGRDFHNFNVALRDDPSVDVVAFTATQIPGIDDRRYPASLAGELYPDGIPVHAEEELDQLIADLRVDRVLFAYSDVTHEEVMHVASRAIGAGASFEILGPRSTCVAATKPVIAISAVRTGCGKSQVARYLSQQLRARGSSVAAIRHPMPYGYLARQAVQRFASTSDIDAAECTIEEREEFEPHVAAGNVIFAGVDYGAIVQAAQEEADLLIWDGGNNDFPFVTPDFHIVLVDALRPEQLTTHHPGEAVLRMADVVVINKADAATPEQVAVATRGVARIVPDVPVVLAASPVRLERSLEPGTRVLVVEDGPSVTHGGMPFGSGYAAVRNLDVDIIDPRHSASPEIDRVYARYPHLGPVLPAMGYNPRQREALRATIDASDADVVIAGTPIDLALDLPLTKPVVRVRYDYSDHGTPTLMDLTDEFLRQLG